MKEAVKPELRWTSCHRSALTFDLAAILTLTHLSEKSKPPPSRFFLL
jgi:hypothetical protein